MIARPRDALEMHLQVCMPSVTMGAYMNALAALGLDVDVIAPAGLAPANPPPPQKTVRIADHAQLRRLAWQLPPDAELTAQEAWGIYERNWRHADPSALDPRERRLLHDLARARTKAAGCLNAPTTAASPRGSVTACAWTAGCSSRCSRYLASNGSH